MASLDLGERVVTSPTVSTWLGWSGAFVATWALALGALATEGFLVSLALAAVGTLVAGGPFAGCAYRIFSRPRLARVAVVDGSLFVEDELAVRPEEIRAALVVPAGATAGTAQARVELTTGRGRFEVVCDEDEASALVEALGWGPEQHALRFRVFPRISQVAAIVAFYGFAFLLLWVGLHQVFLALGVAALPLLVIALVTSDGEAEAGTDGVRILGLRGQFLGWEQVTGIEMEARGLVLGTASGGLRLSLWIHPWTTEADRRALAALELRLRTTLEAHRGKVRVAGASALARGGRSVATWRRALQQARGSYREAHLEDDHLWRVVESPRASASARGAAAALLAQRAPEEGPRLCEAVATSAQVGLRISVARAAEGRIDEALREAAALEEVLEAAETEKPPRPVGSGGF